MKGKRRYLIVGFLALGAILTVVTLYILHQNRDVSMSEASFQYLGEYYAQSRGENIKSRNYETISDFYNDYMGGLNNTTNYSTCKYIYEYIYPSHGHLIDQLNNVEDGDILAGSNAITDYKKSEDFVADKSERNDFFLELVNTFGSNNISNLIILEKISYENEILNDLWEVTKLEEGNLSSFEINDFLWVDQNASDVWCIQTDSEKIIDHPNVKRIFENGVVQQSADYIDNFIVEEERQTSSTNGVLTGLSYIKNEETKQLIINRYEFNLIRVSTLIGERWAVEDMSTTSFSLPYEVGDEREIMQLLNTI